MHPDACPKPVAALILDESVFWDRISSHVMAADSHEGFRLRFGLNGFLYLFSRDDSKKIFLYFGYYTIINKKTYIHIYMVVAKIAYSSILSIVRNEAERAICNSN